MNAKLVRIAGIVLVLLAFSASIAGATSSTLTAQVSNNVVNVSGQPAAIMLNGQTIWGANTPQAQGTCDLAGKLWRLSWDASNRWLYMEKHFADHGQRLVNQGLRVSCTLTVAQPGDLTFNGTVQTVSAIWSHTWVQGEKFPWGWSAW